MRRRPSWKSWVVLVAVALVAACGDRRSASQALPLAEFLFAAGDSTYWVRSDAEGMRVRSAPILLTQVNGRTYEIFLTDDGAEYPDASFVTARLWARDIQRTDSVSLFADTTVLAELARWRRQFPREAEIDPADENTPDDPRTVVTDEIDIVDVHGPWITIEHLLNLDIDGGPAHRHEGRRLVIDVRTGQRVTLDSLFGSPEAQRVIADAQRSLGQLTDSIRSAGTGGDERAAIAGETLESFVFEATSFGITDVRRAPAVAFMIPGQGSDGEALAIHLPPLGVAEPSWWPQVRNTLPEWAPDSARVRWVQDAYEVAASPTPDGDALALVLIGRRGTAKLEWPIATVATPAYQLIPLDNPPLDSMQRAALARAFDVSTSLDGLVQRAAFRAAPHRPAPRLLWRHASSPSPRRAVRQLTPPRALP